MLINGPPRQRVALVPLLKRCATEVCLIGTGNLAMQIRWTAESPGIQPSERRGLLSSGQQAPVESARREAVPEAALSGSLAAAISSRHNYRMSQLAVRQPDNFPTRFLAAASEFSGCSDPCMWQRADLRIVRTPLLAVSSPCPAALPQRGILVVALQGRRRDDVPCCRVRRRPLSDTNWPKLTHQPGAGATHFADLADTVFRPVSDDRVCKDYPACPPQLPDCRFALDKDSALQESLQWVYSDVAVTLYGGVTGGFPLPVEHERRRQSAIDLDISRGLGKFLLRDILRSGCVQCLDCNCECLRIPAGCGALGKNTSDRNRLLISDGWFCCFGAVNYGGGENDYRRDH